MVVKYVLFNLLFNQLISENRVTTHAQSAETAHILWCSSRLFGLRLLVEYNLDKIGRSFFTGIAAKNGL